MNHLKFAVFIFVFSIAASAAASMTWYWAGAIYGLLGAASWLAGSQNGKLAHTRDQVNYNRRTRSR
jgi:hypothetical protein